MPTVTVNPGGRIFQCEGKQTILEAALAASCSLNYGCSTGTCGLCVARLRSGDLEKVKHHDYNIRSADKIKGDFLTCCHTAASPCVTIEAPQASDCRDIPWQTINAKIKRIVKHNDCVGVLTVQTPRTQRLRYLAGQTVQLDLDSDLTIKLPIASCPCDDRNLEFHLALDGTPFCTELLRVKSLPRPVQIQGPWGESPDFSMRSHFVCIAYGVGFGPLRSWIEQQLAQDSADQIKLFWLTQGSSGDYMANLLTSWRDAFDNFVFENIVCEDEADLKKSSKSMLEAVQKLEHEKSQVLIAGPGLVTKQICSWLDEVGLPSSRRFIYTGNS